MVGAGLAGHGGLATISFAAAIGVAGHARTSCPWTVGLTSDPSCRAEWERSAFEAFDTDSEAIFAYLKTLFGETGSNKQAFKALEALRDNISSLETKLAASEQFNSDALKWAIAGLLASDLLTDEKRAVLKDFINSEVILSELADVLNMRMAALQTWTWGDNVPIEQ